MNAPLRDQVQHLASARMALASLQEVYRKAEANFKQAHIDELTEIARLKELAVSIESGIRQEAEDLRRQGGVVHPAPGIEVKKFQRLSYDAGAALEWALAHGVCVALDVPAFESLMLKSERLPGFITRHPEYRAQIAKDLPKALAVVDVTAPAPDPLVEFVTRGRAAQEAVDRLTVEQGGKQPDPLDALLIPPQLTVERGKEAGDGARD